MPQLIRIANSPMSPIAHFRVLAMLCLLAAGAACSRGPTLRDDALEAALAGYLEQETAWAEPFGADVGDRSIAAEEGLRATRLYVLSDIAGFSAGELSDAGRRLRAAALQRLETLAELDAHGVGIVSLGRISPYRFSAIHGVWTDLPNILYQRANIPSAGAAREWLTSLEAFATTLNDERRRFGADLAAAQAPPPDVLTDTSRAIRAVLTIDPADNPLCLRFAEGLSRLDDLATPDLVAQVAECHAIYRSAVVPALEAFLRDTDAALSSPSAWQGPDSSFYRSAFSFHVSGALSPEQAEGVAEAIRGAARRELGQLLDRIQVRAGPLHERMAQALPAKPAEENHGGEVSAPAPQARIGAMTGEALRVAREAVGVPALTVDAVIATTNPGLSPIATTGSDGRLTLSLDPDALDGLSDQEVFLVLLSDALPGALLSTSATGSPFRPLSDAALRDGWRLYATDLADELGAFDNDPRARAAYLRGIIIKSALLSADIGMNLKGWSRQQGARFLVEEGLMAPPEADAASERIRIFPGEAGAGLVGREKIRNLREDADLELGAAFDLKAFNRALCDPGPRPLPVAEQDVRDYVASEVAAARRQAARPTP